MIATEMKVSISTVKRVWMYWLKNRYLLPTKKPGKKKKELDDDSRNLILQIHKEQNLGARRLEKVLEFKYGKHIPHNAIHRVLLEEGLANENTKKKKRRKPWIRYERKHSLTAVHLDWHTSNVNRKEVCIVLDDSSRCILAGGEFDAATAENSIELIREVLENFEVIRRIEKVITDRGSQFYANKKIKTAIAKVVLKHSLKSWISNTLRSRVKHLQTNGKFEKWYDLYERHWSKSKSLTNS
jgi:putative transposase